MLTAPQKRRKIRLLAREVSGPVWDGVVRRRPRDAVPKATRRRGQIGFAFSANRQWAVRSFKKALRM
jgi:hypothetical protein